MVAGGGGRILDLMLLLDLNLAITGLYIYYYFMLTGNLFAVFRFRQNSRHRPP